jgi:outer membrane receptor for ferrienterochelin and colicin
MNPMLRRSLLIRCAALCAFLRLLSGDPAVYCGTDGTLEGTVRNKKTHEPLLAVNIAIVGTQRGTATDTNGYFAVPNLRAGRYAVRFSCIGYTGHLLKDVIITPDLRTRLSVEMEPSDVQLEEIVVVQQRPAIQTDVTGTTYVLAAEELTPMPVTNITEAVKYRAGITAEGNIRGGKSTEVLYLVDGLPIQDLVSGGVGAQLPNSAITGLTVHTGGFEAQYGNALSGVVNVVTRTGNDQLRILARGEMDHVQGGTQVSKTGMVEAGASGPIIPERLHFLVSFDGLQTGTRWWQDFQHYLSLPVERFFNGFAKVDLQATPSLRVGAQFLGSRHDWHDYEFAWRYNLNGLPPEQQSSYRAAAIVSHVVSPVLTYTASLSRYWLRSQIGEGDGRGLSAEDPYQYDFFLRYVVDGTRAWWGRTTQVSYTLKSDATVSINRDHLLKFGGEFTFFDIASDLVKYEPRKTYFGKPLINEPQLDFSTSFTYRPRAGALYIQSKTDNMAQGSLLNFGLRYDFLDPRAERPRIESVPVADSAYFLPTGGAVPASVKHQVSPRFGAAMQVAEHGYLFVNLGWYFQFPLFKYFYSGLDRVALGRGMSALTGNPDLEPERTKMWEISFKYSLPEQLVASVTYFRKDATNLVDTKTFIPGDSKIAGSYGFAEYVNTPYGTSNGLEVLLTRERGDWITGEISYTFMQAEAVSGSSSDGFYIAQWGLPPATRVYPLSWDQRHTVKAQLVLTLPEAFTVGTATEWHTGRPYTAYPTSTGFEKINGGKFYQNNARMPAYLNIDLKIEKRFHCSEAGPPSLALYLDSRNILNQRNVQWMDSNGRIGGELGDPSGYFTGRRTSLGLRFEY